MLNKAFGIWIKDFHRSWASEFKVSNFYIYVYIRERERQKQRETQLIHDKWKLEHTAIRRTGLL